MANTFGLYNPNSTLNDQGIKNCRSVFFNLNEAELFEAAIQRSEGVEGIGGSLLVKTGKFTGRSPNDKYIVFSKSSEHEIWWNNNAQMKAKHFDRLHADMLDFINDKELFVQDLYAGADPDHRINIRVISELVWHNLFMRHLLIKPDPSDLNNFYSDFNIINIPSFKANPKKHGCRSETAIAINLDAKLVLIAGTEYGGENKKAVFTILNYLLPKKDVLPMHCAANRVSDRFSASAIFFGLSGTGKTTLSTDGKRVLIGDDEHGWSDNGLFNFEGGCYAKTFGLSAETEPEIFATTTKFATVIENMVYDEETKKLDFFDSKLTANMRAAYPMHYVTRSAIDGLGENPKYLIMLTCDAFGVLPPVASLSAEQAMYHFLSGFTSKAVGTERGVMEPEPTFSPCFGAPFLPLKPEIYGDILKRKIIGSETRCWLVNTGWTGGPYGIGSRMPIKATRAILETLLSGELDNTEFRKDYNFGFTVPMAIKGVDRSLLNPRDNWKNSVEYDKAALKLVKLFEENFAQHFTLRKQKDEAVFPN
jgi:phosphoenolpyruvate carboxykinase (ATP)